MLETTCPPAFIAASDRTPWRCRGRWRRVVGWLCLALVALTARALAQDPIGHVMELVGDWTLYPSPEHPDKAQALLPDQDLVAGAVIRLRTPSPSASITVVDRSSGRILAERDCRRDDCQQPLDIPDTAPGESDLGPFLDRIWRLMAGDPYRLSMHRSRGGAPILDEGVVLSTRGKADVANTMRHAPKGRYGIERYPKRSGAQKMVTAFDWNPDQPTLVPIGSASDGLYEIALRRAASPYLADARVSVLVLLCDEPAFRTADSRFRQAVALTATWGDHVQPETVHAFLRGGLMELASSARRSGSR
jgi:hypothetical protein